MQFGISEGKGGGVKRWKPSMVGYGYFLELPNVTFNYLVEPESSRIFCCKVYKRIGLVFR